MLILNKNVTKIIYRKTRIRLNMDHIPKKNLIDIDYDMGLTAEMAYKY